MKNQVIRNSTGLGIVFISIVIFLSGSCQKEPVIISNSSLALSAASCELKSAYYWGSGPNGYMGELILAGLTIYFDGPSGFFNSNGKSAFVNHNEFGARSIETRRL